MVSDENGIGGSCRVDGVLMTLVGSVVNIKELLLKHYYRGSRHTPNEI